MSKRDSDFNVNLLHFYPKGLSVYSIILCMHVSYQVFYLILNAVNQLLERGVIFHSINLQSPLQRMLCAKFDMKFPMDKGAVIHLNKLESPLPKDALRQVWLKLDQWFWR